MFSRAITRRTRTGPTPAEMSAKDRLHRPPQALLEVDVRLPAERLARGRDVRPRVADVARPRPGVHRLDGPVEQAADGASERRDALGRAGGDVEDAADRFGRVGGEQVRSDDVVDVR